MKRIFKISLAIATAFSLGACSDWLDVNDDPNNPTNVAAEFVLPAAQISVAATVGGNFAIVGGLWSQHWTQSHVASQYKDLDSYDLQGNDYNIAWTELYAGGLNDFEDVKTKATTLGNNNMLLQAEALQAYGFMTLTDWFDKIPFTEALKVSEIQAPKFDDGQAVYAALLSRLDAALALDFDNGTSTKVASDLVFGNLGSATAQIDSWKRFANTLKLKMYLRQTASANSAQAITAISAMLAANTPFLTTHAAITQFIDQPDRSNPLYENNVRQLNVASNLRLSKTFQSFLEANNDQLRLNAYFTPGTTGQFGLEQGDFNANSIVILGGVPSTARMTALDPVYFFSRDEVYFLLAEAYLLTVDDAAAKTNYDLAVAAAYTKFGLTMPASKIAPGGEYEFPSSGTTAEMHEAIMMQKWVAMFRQGAESYWDQARTGYPRISPVPTTNGSYVPGEWTMAKNAVTTAFPKRLLYPDASRDVNPNTPARPLVTDKIWWMP
jgi:Starch-binding associating with outer membrane